jgi:hypothetical protein
LCMVPDLGKYILTTILTDTGYYTILFLSPKLLNILVLWLTSFHIN